LVPSKRGDRLRTEVIKDEVYKLDLGLRREYHEKGEEDFLDIDKDEMKVEDWRIKTQLEREKLEHEQDQYRKIEYEIAMWQKKSIQRELAYRKDIDKLQNEIAAKAKMAETDK